MMDPSTDGELLAAAARARPEAVGELYRRHGDGVYALALRITGSADDADDVLQDVFVGLPRALQSYTERGRFSAWLRRVTVRVALSRLRAAKRKRQAPLEVGSSASVADAGAHPVDRITLERAIARLPEKQRVVFVLREIEGYPHGEIADLLGITEGASMVRLSRAWSALRKEAMP
jgi:RNA polymerase sigma-70 factor (ECF subfamily)